MKKNKFYTILLTLIFNFFMANKSYGAAAGHNYSERLTTIEEIDAIPYERRETITSEALKYTTEDMSPTDVSNLIHLFLSFPNDEDRKELIEQASKVIDEDMKGSHRILVFDALYTMEIKERQNFVEEFLRDLRIPSKNKAYFIGILSKFREPERTNILKYLKLSLYNTYKPGSEKPSGAVLDKETDIINVLLRIPEHELPERIKRSTEQSYSEMFFRIKNATGYTPSRDLLKASIEPTKDEYLRAIEYLNTPLDRPLPIPEKILREGLKETDFLI